MQMSSPLLSRAAGCLPTSVLPGLAARIAQHQGELIPLHIGDTYLAPPVFPDRLDLHDPTLYRYGKIAGHEPLVRALAERLARRAGYPGGDCIQLSAGATHAICSAARVTLEPGDEALVAAPYWPLTTGMISACGATPVEVPLTEELLRHPGRDVREILAPYLTPRTRALYLTTPNNPDGKVLSRAQLEGIAEIAVQRDLWVLSDEVYEHYTYDAPHVPVASLPGMCERTLTCFSFSKSHGLAGLRIGYLLGPPAAIAAVRAMHFHTLYAVPLLVQKLALLALEEGDAWLARARTEYRSTRDAVAEVLRDSPVPVPTPEGGSYFFLDLAPLLQDRPLMPLLERLLERSVSVAPGSSFGREFGRRVRLCFTAAPKARVVEGTGRLVELLRTL